MGPERNPLQLSEYIVRLRRYAFAHGIALSCHQDFAELRRLAVGLEDRPGIQPYFDVSQSETGVGNAFWLKGVNGAGEVVHIQAVRRIDLGETSLSDHLSRFRRLYTIPGVDIDLNASEVKPNTFAQEITGVCCYHGEIWLRRDLRHLDLGEVLPRLAVAIAQIQWQPRYMYGLIVPQLALKGSTTRTGYYHVQPSPFVWRNGLGEVVRRVWLVMMEASEFFDLIASEELIEAEERESPMPVAVPAE